MHAQRYNRPALHNGAYFPMIALGNFDTDVRETRAIDRDFRDAEHLAGLDALVCQWLDQLLPYVHPLSHPYARWQPGELADALRDALIDIRGETARLLAGPVVIDDEDCE